MSDQNKETANFFVYKILFIISLTLIKKSTQLLCDPKNCNYGGICHGSSESGEFNCECVSSMFTGNNCTNEINHCELDNPCSDDSTCM